MIITNCFLIVVSSWAVGAAFSQIIKNKPLYFFLLRTIIIKQDQWNRYFGVDLFKYLVTKTVYGKINRAIRITNNNCKELVITKNEIVKSEVGHAIDFLSSQVAFVLIHLLNDENLYLLTVTILNLLLNLYPVLLQQKNRVRIDKILKNYCC